MKRITIVLLLSVVLLTACGKSESTMNHASPSDSESQAGSSPMDHSGKSEAADATQAGKVQAQFKFSNEKLLSNQATSITIQLQDKDNKPLDKLDTVHEKQMHLIIVSKDLSYFNHIHPDNKGNGEFTISTQLPSAGEYKLIADITPTGMGAMSKSTWVTVQGSVPSSKPIVPDTTLTKVVEGKEVTLSIDHLMANMELKLNFHIQDAQTKQPVKDLQPYLGAVGHVVILTEDAETYLHVHPTDEKASGPDAVFMTTFPRSGVYKIWGQFQQNGRVFTVPFVVKVP